MEIYVIATFRDEFVSDRDIHDNFLKNVGIALKWLNEKKLKLKNYSEPGLTKFYRLAAGVIFDKGEFPKFESSDQVKEVFDQILPEDIELQMDISVYDHWRIHALSEFVLVRL